MGSRKRLAGVFLVSLVLLFLSGSSSRSSLETWLWAHTDDLLIGVLFAACLMTAVDRLSTAGGRGSFAFAGLLFAVSARRSVGDGAGRMETRLAARLGFPAMHAVVLGLLVALLPWYMVLARVYFSLLLILVGIPLLSRTFRSRDAQDDAAFPPLADGVADAAPLARGSVLRGFLRNLGYVFLRMALVTVLAGLLGMLAKTYVPASLIAHLEDLSGGPTRSLLVMGFLAAVGTFLPFPFAFDVVLAAALVEAGLPVRYTMVLLFTLGTYDLLSFARVGRSTSGRVAVALAVVVACAGVASGVTTHYLKREDDAIQELIAFRAAFQPDAVERIDPVPPAAPALAPDSLARLLAAHRTRPTPFPVSYTDAGEHVIEVERSPFQPRSTGGRAMFQRIPGKAMGLDVPAFYASDMHVTYHKEFVRGIASGDVHNDGWPDLLVTGHPDVGGLYLYANEAGRRFVRQQLDLGDYDKSFVLNAALVDLNDDGWQDIFFTTLQDGNFVLFNRHGTFHETNPVFVSAKANTSATAFGVGDLDVDGDLDVVLGNYSAGFIPEFNPPVVFTASRNQILRQDGGRFEPEDMSDFPGETDNILLSDFNQDGYPDIIVGNDWRTSDMFYEGDGHNGFRLITGREGIIPRTPLSTMDVVSADVDNDLKLELFLGNVTVKKDRLFHQSRLKQEHLWTKTHDPEERQTARYASRVVTLVNDPTAVRRDTSNLDPGIRASVLANHILERAARTLDPRWRLYVPEGRADLRFMMDRLFSESVTVPDDTNAFIPQIRVSNVMLVRDSLGRYHDEAEARGLEESGWTWNAQFADLDNDEWQDLYVANGWIRSPFRDSNRFFHNRGDGTFLDRTIGTGLSDYFATSAYTYVDYDLDGDLDIVSLPLTVPIRVFKNDTQHGNSIAFEIRDHAGNRFGIGAKIVVSYGPGGARHQLRELLASGGFCSFNAPVAYFGLGEYDVVETVSVEWPGGRTTRIEGPFPAGSLFTLSRQGK